MPCNVEMADRVRAALVDQEVREVRMFGGLAFMVAGRMLVCVSAGGADLLVRVAPGDHAVHVQRPGAAQAEMGAGRSMGPGWIAVDQQALTTEEDLTYWMAAAWSFHHQASTSRRGSKADRK